MNVKIQGVYTALITPFNTQGQVCEKTYRTLLHSQEKGNVDGVVVLGTTAEEPTLDARERDQLIQIAVEELKGKLPIIVGCGATSTQKTVDSALKAEDLGADGLLVINPYYNKPTQEGMILHFEALSKAVHLPICLYNHPGRSGQNIEVQTVMRLAELPNIIGVKECTGNFQQITDIIEKVCHKRPGFTILSGDDPVTLPMMAVGAHGVVSVLSNLLPRTTASFVRAIQQGNFALARAMHYALKPLFQALSIETNPIPIKYMMHIAGLDTGIMRLPMCQPTRQSQEKLQHIFDACQHVIQEELHPERYTADADVEVMS